MAIVKITNMYLIYQTSAAVLLSLPRAGYCRLDTNIFDIGLETDWWVISSHPKKIQSRHLHMEMKHIKSTEKRKRKTKNKNKARWNNNGTQYPLDNNTGHSGNNYNSTTPEISIRDFHGSTCWPTWAHTNLELHH